MHVNAPVYVTCRLILDTKLGTVLIDVEITKAYAHLSFGGSMLTKNLDFLFLFFKGERREEKTREQIDFYSKSFCAGWNHSTFFLCIQLTAKFITL